MKNLNFIYFLLLAVNFSFGQNINFTDINFKNKLLQANTTNNIAIGHNWANIKIDINNDNEIDQYEMTLIKTLNINGSDLSNLEGIQYATYLTFLRCQNNQITDISPISNLQFLQELNCSNNLISNISNVPYLMSVDCSFNQLVSLDFSQTSSLFILKCNDNFITNIVFPINNPTLHGVDCSNNLISSLYIEGAINLGNASTSYTLNFENNPLTSISLINCTNFCRLYNSSFGRFYVANSQLISLNLSGCERIYEIKCQNNNLTSLTLNGMKSLKSLDCSNNQLTDLNFNGMEYWIASDGFYNLQCNNNNLTSLTISGDIYYQGLTLNCNDNSFTDLDLSTVNNLKNFYCDNNSNLTFLNLKNNTNENIISFANCPNLSLICQDQPYLQGVQSLVDYYGYTNCSVNSSCLLNISNFENEKKIIIFPNPVDDILFINTNNDNLQNVSVYNSLGQLILENQRTSIDVSNLQNGIYFVKVSYFEKEYSHTFIKN